MAHHKSNYFLCVLVMGKKKQQKNTLFLQSNRSSYALEHVGIQRWRFQQRDVGVRVAIWQISGRSHPMILPEPPLYYLAPHSGCHSLHPASELFPGMWPCALSATVTHHCGFGAVCPDGQGLAFFPRARLPHRPQPW